MAILPATPASALGCALLCTLATGALASPLLAQGSGAGLAARGGLAARVGVTDPGIDCSDIPRVSLGAEARTSGPVALSIVAEGFVRPFDVPCTGPGPVPVMYEGEEVIRQTEVSRALRASARLHYSRQVSGVTLDLAGSVGAMPGRRVTAEGETERQWQPWLSTVVGISPSASRFRVEVEVGRHVDRSDSWLAVDDGALIRSERHWRSIAGVTMAIGL